MSCMCCFISQGIPLFSECVMWGLLFYWLVSVPWEICSPLQRFVSAIKVDMSAAGGKQTNNGGQDDEGEEEDDEVGDLVSAINYNTINYNTISSMAVLKEILGKINKIIICSSIYQQLILIGIIFMLKHVFWVWSLILFFFFISFNTNYITNDWLDNMILF